MNDIKWLFENYGYLLTIGRVYPAEDFYDILGNEFGEGVYLHAYARKVARDLSGIIAVYNNKIRYTVVLDFPL